MNFATFQLSLQNNVPPAGVSVYLAALWYDANSEWHQAHAMVDQLDDSMACRVHAYLHRKEGDQGNAAYWYRRAGIPQAQLSLQKEWELLVKALL